MILQAARVAEAFHACGLKPPRMMVRTRSLESAQQLLATGRFLTAAGLHTDAAGHALLARPPRIERHKGGAVPGGGHPLVGRERDPEDVAAAVKLLCSPGGRFITGQTIHVSGGIYLP